MPKKHADWASLLDFTINKSGNEPIYRQIHSILCQAILDGRVASGVPLPSSRSLAKQIGVSRTSVVEAFDLLTAEGYVESRQGSGTFVADLEDLELIAPPIQPVETTGWSGKIRQKERVDLLAEIGRSAKDNATDLRPFAAGRCTLDARTRDAWRRVAAPHYRSLGEAHLGYSSPQGSERLREQIAAYIAASRSVVCDPSQIVIVSGTQQAIDIVIRTLLTPESRVWIEDPSYPSTSAALDARGVESVPIPIDKNGLMVKAGKSLAPDAECVFVTPSHQFLTGAVMSMPRRLELLRWAEKAGAWIVEDDYDSEYRYAGRPIAALKGLDSCGSVIYVGTFSKVLFPGLRLGYLVAPPALVDAFSGCRALLDRHPSTIQQEILADFLAEGHFLSHIRRTRSLYKEALDVTIDGLNQALYGHLRIRKPDAGMQLVVDLPHDVSDVDVCQALRKNGVVARPLSPLFRTEEHRRPGIVLGFTGYPLVELTRVARRAGDVMKEVIT